MIRALTLWLEQPEVCDALIGCIMVLFAVLALCGVVMYDEE